MSIAVAVRTGKGIVIAADSQSNWGSETADPRNHQAHKIMTIGESLVAMTGWSLYQDILLDYVKRLRRATLTDQLTIFSFFRDFWKALHEDYAFVNDQCAETDSPFGNLDSDFLVVNHSGIFAVSANMSVATFERYHAIGSGCAYSLGALHVLYDEQADPAALARKAVETAITFSVYCGGTIEVHSVSA